MSGASMLSASERGIRFKRNDLQTCAATSRHCIRVLPGKKSRQKVVYGDHSGSVTAFSVGKKNEIKTEFTTLRSPIQSDKPIASIDLYEDQIFFASGNRVTAVSKKGKAFFILETQLTEAMQTLRVAPPFVFIGGDYLVSAFQESAERGSIMCPDRVNSFIIQPEAKNSAVIDLFVACQDRMLRTVRANEVKQECSCESPLYAIAFSPEKEGTLPSIVYGTVGGSLGGFKQTPDGLVRLYHAIPPSRAGGINGIVCGDITKDGTSDVILCRDDGCIEVHNAVDQTDSIPKKIWAGYVGECVTGVDWGCITTSEREEVIISTYSGKIISFSYTEEDIHAQQVVPEMLQSAQEQLPVAAKSRDQSADDASVAKAKTEEVLADMTKIRQDIMFRKQELVRQQAKMQQLQGKQVEQSQIHQQMMNPPQLSRSQASPFSLRTKFFLDDSAVITLAVELDVPLDLVTLRSTVAVELIEVEGDGNVISVTEKTRAPSSTVPMLAVYRNTDPASRRLQLHLRPVEGESGELSIVALPRVAAPRSAQTSKFLIPPLGLHQRLQDESSAKDPASDPTLTAVKVFGQFSVKDAHSWLYRAMFDIPERFSGSEVLYVMKNTFVGSLLYVRVAQGEIELHSHNVTALTILKEVIMKQATARKIQLRLQSDPKNDSIAHILGLLHDRIEHQARIGKHAKLIGGLAELEVQEQDVSFLAQEYKDILANAKQIESENAQLSKRVGYIGDLLVRLLHDWGRMRGDAVPPAREAQLRQLLQNYDRQLVLEFFIR